MTEAAKTTKKPEYKIAFFKADQGTFYTLFDESEESFRHHAESSGSELVHVVPLNGDYGTDALIPIMRLEQYAGIEDNGSPIKNLFLAAFMAGRNSR